MRRQDAGQDAARNQDRPRFVSTGLASLDRAMRGGFPVGELSMVAARPQVGATSLLVGAALAALGRGERAAYFSERLRSEQVRGRFVVLDARVNGFRFRAGFVTAEDRLALAAARERIPWASLSVVSRRQVSASEIDGHLFSYGPLLVIADVRPRAGEASDPNRFTALMEGVQHLVGLARRHQVALVLRWILAKGSRPPGRVDLPGMGKLADPFDTVLLLHRDDVSPPADAAQDAHVGEASADVVRVAGHDVEARHVALRFDQRFAGLFDA